MSYSRSYKSSSSYKYSGEDDGDRYGTSTSRYSTGASSSARSSLLAELDRELSSGRKKLRSEDSYDFGTSTATGSGYGSSRRFDSATASIGLTSSSASRPTVRSSLLGDDDDDDNLDKYSPRRLAGRLAGYKSSMRSQDEPEESSVLTGGASASTSYSYSKRTRYRVSGDNDDDDDDGDDNAISYSSKALRKYSASGREEPYEAGESRFSSRFRSRLSETGDDEDSSAIGTSRLLSKQSSLTRTDPDDYSSVRSYSLNREGKSSTSTTTTGGSRFLRYTSTDLTGDDKEDLPLTSSRSRLSRYDRDSSRDDDLSTTGSRYSSKLYSRESSVTGSGTAAGSEDVLRERNLNLGTSRTSNEYGSAIGGNSTSSVASTATFQFRSERKKSIEHRDSSNGSKFALYDTDSIASKRSLTESANSGTLDDKENAYYVVIDYQPPKSSPDEIPLKEGQRVTVLSKDKPHKWKVQTHKFKDVEGIVGFAPSCYLELLDENAPAHCLESSEQDSGDTGFSAQQAEKKRKNIVKELLETEEDFNRDMQFIANTYLKHMDSSLMPKHLREQKSELFNHFRQIAAFHHDLLSKGVQFYAQQPPAKLGQAFLRMEREFDQHVAYCHLLPQVQQTLTEGEFKEYFDGYSQKIKDDKRLSDHLKLPVQRINDYQLLLKELIKYTARLNEDTKELEKALELMQAIPQRAIDLQVIDCIQGYKSNLHNAGRLLRQDWFEVTDADQRTKDRYCFLFKQKLLITDQQNLGYDKKIYLIKNQFKLNEINCTQQDANSIVLSRKSDELNSQLPVVLKSNDDKQITAWLEQIHNCRQLSRDELADEPEPEFEIIPADVDKSERRLSRRQSSTETVDIVQQLVKSSSPKVQQPSSRQESVVEDDRIEIQPVESKPEPETVKRSSSLRRSTSRTSDSVKSDLPSEPTTPMIVETPSKDLEESPLKRTQSRDLPEGLPKPVKSSGDSKRSSLSRQSSQEPGSRRTAGDRTPEAGLSRKNSTSDKNALATTLPVTTSTSGSKLSSRQSSVNSDRTEPLLSRRNSVKQQQADSANETTSKPLSRSTSRRSSRSSSQTISEPSTPSVPTVETKSADVEMFEEKQSVPVDDSVIVQDLGRTAPTTSVRQLDSSKAKPIFKRELSDQQTTSDENVRFECVLSPEIAKHAAVEWLRDGKILNLAGRYRAYVDDEITHALQISRVIDEDAGEYTALVTTSTGQVKSSARLRVRPEDVRPCTPGGSLLPSAPIFKIRLKDTTLPIDSTVRFELLLHAHPQAEVIFSKDGLPLKEDDHVRIKHKSGEAYEIIVDKIRPSDAGSYSVRAVNSEGEDHTSCVLKVSDHETDVFKYLPDEPSEISESPKTSYSPALDRSSSVQSPAASGSRPRTPAFKWFRDGNEFDASERFLCQFNEDEDTIGLIFQHVTPEDAGLYTCVASTHGGKISCSAELTVQGEVNRLLRDPEPPRFETQLIDAVVNQGSTATIEVKVTGYPRPTISWLHDGQPITLPSDKHKLLYEQDDSMTLIIKNAQPGDAGRYQLTATNELGEAQDECKLQVQCAPQLLDSLKDQRVQQNQPLTLQLRTLATPQPDIRWFKDGKPLDSESNKQESLQTGCEQQPDGSYVYTLKNDKAQLADAGHYSCTLSNPCGQQSSDCEVAVESAPKISGMDDLAGNEGDTVQFRVQVTGSPAPQVEFLRNGKSVQLDKLVSLEQEQGGVYRLQFAKLSSAMCGEYMVQAKNALGQVSAKGRLDLRKAPQFVQPLTDSSCKEGDDEVRLTVKLSGFPPPTVKFRRNGKELPVDDDRFEVITLKQGDCVLHTLVIKKPTLDDAGDVEVIAENNEGSDKCSARLTVKSAPRFIRKPPGVLSIRSGEGVDLEAICVGVPKPSLKWTCNGQTLSAVGDSNVQIITKETGDNQIQTRLKLINVTTNARYECVATNELGESKAGCDLNVDSRPVLVRTFTDQTVNEGDQEVAFKIALRKQQPEPKVEFSLNGKPISDQDARFEIRRRDTTVPVPPSPAVGGTIKLGRRGSRSAPSEEAATEYTLIIHQAIPELAGTVSCCATNQLGSADCQAEFNVRRKPRFIQPLPAQITGSVDASCTLTVRASGCPKPKLQWYHNGQELSTSATIKIQEQQPTDDEIISTLQIDHLTLQLFGDFECLAVNEAGEVRTRGTLNKVSPPSFEGELQDQSEYVGEKVEFEIRVTGEPEPQITWLRDGREIGQGLDFLPELQQGKAKLVISDLKLSHEATYQVVAKNEHGHAQSNQAKLKVLQPKAPSFDQKLTDQSTIKGEQVVFEAKLSGQPSPQVEWTRNGHPLSDNDDRVHIERKPDGQCRLVLNDIKPEDAAEYACVAQNPSGKAASKAKLNVQEPCQPKITGLQDQQANLGDRVQLQVQVHAIPTAKVEWFKDGQPIESGDGIRLEQLPDGVYTLTIDQLSSPLLGTYTVRASNCVGEQTADAVISMRQTPPSIGKHLSPIVKVNEGNDLVFTGQVKGHPPPTAQWYKNGQPVEPSDRIIVEQFPDGTCVLTVHNAQPSDEGDYELRANSPLGNISSKGRAEVVSKPQFIQDLPETANAPAGEALQLSVVVKSHPSATVDWFKGGDRIEHRLDVAPIEQLPDNLQRHVITIPSLNEKAAGLYHCKATNRHGQIKSTNCNVQPQQESAPSFGQSLQDVHTVKNDSVRLPVQVDGAPRPVVHFLKDGQPIKVGGAGDRIRIESDPNTGTHILVIDLCSPDDQAVYTCVASNPSGETSCSAKLIITDPKAPQIRGLDDLEARLGESVTLAAEISGVPTPEVQWFCNGVAIGQFQRDMHAYSEEISQLGGDSSEKSGKSDDSGAKLHCLRIHSVQNEHVGDYSVRARNHFGEATKAAKLELSPTAPLLMQPLPDRVKVKEGNQLRLEAKLVGFPMPCVQWLRNGLPIRTSNIQDHLSGVANRAASGSSLGGTQLHSAGGVAERGTAHQTVSAVDHQPIECVVSNDIYNNERAKIENFSNGVCILTIEKMKDEDEGVYSILGINEKGEIRSDCNVHVVSKYYREYSPPPSIKEKMQNDPNYRPAEWGLKNRKPNEPFNFRSETQYQIGPDTYVLQYRDTDFPLRIREYLRVGSSRSPSLASNLREGHWGYAHPDTGYYPAVSVRERRRFTDGMDEEIDDEKKAEHPRSQPMRLIREIATNGRAYGQLQTLRSEVAASKTLSGDPTAVLKAEIPFFREKVKDQYHCEGEECVFSCLAVGEPQPDYTWFKNDCILLEGGRFQVELDESGTGRCTLRIRSVQPIDSGCYKCLARNINGAVVCRARLLVTQVSPAMPNERECSLDYQSELRPTPLKTDCSLGNNFELGQVLSRGRFSVVLQATERDSRRLVAVKLTPADSVDARNERDLLTTVCHERLVRMEWACERDSNGFAWLVLEQLSGMDVLQYLSAQRVYTEQLVVRLITQVIDGLEYLHFRGICMLELQPDNVVMVRQTQPFIKLVDFSQARRVSPRGEHHPDVQGEAEFLPPEVLKKEKLFYSADVWGVGVLAYLLLSAVSPFKATTEAETIQNVCFVRFHFDLLYKEVSQEAIRFLMLIFKRMPEKRPTIEECLDHKWLLPNEQLVKKRESILFTTSKISDYSQQFHTQKSSSTPEQLLSQCPS